MFTAIQNFMDDSFHSMGIGDVRSIEMGDRHHVAFGRGHALLFYVVYRGRESNHLEQRVIHFVHDVENRFASILRDWNGDMDRIVLIRDYGHVDAGDAGAEEEGGRGDRFSLPPPQVIPDERVGSETHAPEVIEQSADGGVRHFVSRREGGEPDPQRVFVPHRLDGELRWRRQMREQGIEVDRHAAQLDRKSTRLNSSHVEISYAVFCLKKKKKKSIM